MWLPGCKKMGISHFLAPSDTHLYLRVPCSACSIISLVWVSLVCMNRFLPENSAQFWGGNGYFKGVLPTFRGFSSVCFRAASSPVRIRRYRGQIKTIHTAFP